MKKTILTIGMSLLAIFSMYTQAYAQVQIDPNLAPGYAANIESKGGNRATPINIILELIAGSLIYAAGPVAVLMIAAGGFRYVTSHGDQTQMEGAKKTILWAIIGLLVIIVSYAIVTNVINIVATTGKVGTDVVDTKLGY